MATLRRVKNAKGKPWEVRWRDPRTGSQPRRRYATRELADRAYREVLRVEGLDVMAPLERDATVADLIRLEAESSPRTDNKTRRGYIRNHVPETFLARSARTVVIEDVEALLAVAATKLCRASVTKLRGILSSVFRYGHQRRYCDTNPVSGARIPARCQTSQRARKMVNDEVDPDEIPSPGEVTAIANAIQSRFRVLVLILGFFGLRLGEAVGLDVSDWNPTTRLMRIRRSGAQSTETKGHRSFRDVDVPEQLAQILDTHIATYCQSDGPLFPTLKGCRLNPHNFRKRAFYPAVDKALEQDALDEQQRRRIRPHDLRHTAATMMIEYGVSDTEIAQQLGHANAVFTRRVYAGVWRRKER